MGRRRVHVPQQRDPPSKFFPRWTFFQVSIILPSPVRNRELVASPLGSRSFALPLTSNGGEAQTSVSPDLLPPGSPTGLTFNWPWQASRSTYSQHLLYPRPGQAVAKSRLPAHECVSCQLRAVTVTPCFSAIWRSSRPLTLKTLKLLAFLLVKRSN